MSGAWGGGKGDAPRKVDQQKFADNWNKIFGKGKDLHKPTEGDKK